jgi:hypothetical protein
MDWIDVGTAGDTDINRSQTVGSADADKTARHSEGPCQY